MAKVQDEIKYDTLETSELTFMVWILSLQIVMSVAFGFQQRVEPYSWGCWCGHLVRQLFLSPTIAKIYGVYLILGSITSPKATFDRYGWY